MSDGIGKAGGAKKITIGRVLKNAGRFIQRTVFNDKYEDKLKSIDFGDKKIDGKKISEREIESTKKGFNDEVERRLDVIDRLHEKINSLIDRYDGLSLHKKTQSSQVKQESAHRTVGGGIELSDTAVAIRRETNELLQQLNEHLDKLKETGSELKEHMTGINKRRYEGISQLELHSAFLPDNLETSAGGSFINSKEKVDFNIKKASFAPDPSEQ